MPEPFIGEIRLFSGGSVPQGWAPCNGQLLQIAQSSPLFTLIGTTYGGDGVTTFALPDLQGRVPVNVAALFALGQAGGEENHTLTLSELVYHNHPAIASSNSADQASSANNFWAPGGLAIFTTAPQETMLSSAVTPNGGGQAHPNLAPYLVLNLCIALEGVYPSRN
jgi:microcystin-dependent protein